MHWALQLGKETGTRGSGIEEPDVLDSLTCKQALWVVVHAGYDCRKDVRLAVS